MEGDLNADSSWQMVPEGVTVMSFDTECGLRSDAVRKLVSRFARVFVWADAAGKAADLTRQLPGARGIHSP